MIDHKPHILLLDLKTDIENLKNEMYILKEGSLGIRYKPSRQEYEPIYGTYSLPSNLEEFNVVIIDLLLNDAITLNRDNFKALQGKDGTAIGIQSRYLDNIDPRPLASYLYQGDFGQIFSRGGVFIVFAHANVSEEYVQLDERGHSFGVPFGRGQELDLWDFLPIFTNGWIQITSRHSTKLSMVRNEGSLLAKYIDSANSYCSFAEASNFAQNNQYQWIPLVENSLDECVGGIIHHIESGGLVYILPQLQDKVGFLRQFLLENLPDIKPNLFPDSSKKSWLNDPVYQLPEVRDLESKIEQIRIKANAEIEQLANRITQDKVERQYLADLLTEQHEVLVQAVYKSLIVLGFNEDNLIDSDAELEEDETRYEDLRIDESNSDLLLIEVKGSNGLFTKDDKLAVRDHLLPRAQQFNRLYIKGLSLINHQRHKPPLQRQNPFSNDVVLAATNLKIGLMTTWSLWKLVRGFLHNSWNHENVRNLFYQTGVIEPIPTHYQLLGTVENVLRQSNVLAIYPQIELSVGDWIAIITETEYIEHEILSLQVNAEDRQTAYPNEPTGIRIQSVSHLSKKQTVYLIPK